MNSPLHDTPSLPSAAGSFPAAPGEGEDWRVHQPARPRKTPKTSGGLLGELRLRELTALHVALGALVLVSVGRAHDHVGILAALRPGLTLTAFCMLIAVVKPASLRLDNVFTAWPAKAMIALGCSAVLSAFSGLSLGASGSFLLESMMPVIVFFFLATVSFRTVNDLRWIILAYIGACAAVFLASIFLSDAMHFGGYTRQGGAGMYDGNDIGVVYMVGLPLAVVMLRSRTRLLQLFGALAVVGILVSLVMTASRGGFLGLLAGGLAVVLLSPGWSLMQKGLVIVLPAVAMLVLAPDGYWDQMRTILNPQEDYNLTSDTGRMAIWTRGLGYVAEYPVFGLGPDNFVRAGWFISDAGRAGLAGAHIRDQAPHNTFLQVWAELGSVGLIIWLSILGYGIVAPLRLRSRMPKWWLDRSTGDHRMLFLTASYLPASFVGFALTSFFVSHAYTPIFYALVAMLAGFMIVGERSVSASKYRGAP